MIGSHFVDPGELVVADGNCDVDPGELVVTHGGGDVGPGGLVVADGDGDFDPGQLESNSWKFGRASGSPLLASCPRQELPLYTCSSHPHPPPHPHHHHPHHPHYHPQNGIFQSFFGGILYIQSCSEHQLLFFRTTFSKISKNKGKF